MEEYSVYEDMANRTGGDIYVGVVGPVRTGKSTFIKKFMECLVIPAASPKDRAVMIDELPQSSHGKTVMTTEPKFVPAQAAKIKLREGAEVKVRLVDCVGFAVEGANGFEEDGAPRLIETPWQSEAMPFEAAAELGTKKVIGEHSTVGVLVTTDGSIAGISRENYVRAEECAVAELKRLGKPFVILLNCVNPDTAYALKLELEAKYEASVLAINVLEMEENQALDVMREILFEFPLTQLEVGIPKWLQSLPEEDKRVSKLISALKEIAPSLVKMRDVFKLEKLFTPEDGFISPQGIEMDLGRGKAEIYIDAKDCMFYEALSEECGEKIDGEYALMNYVRALAQSKKGYDKIKDAFRDAEESGYGIVQPQDAEFTLEEPRLIKRSAGYGVQFKAKAPGYHILKVDVCGEVTPIIGTKEQGETFSKEVVSGYESGDGEVWQTNIFGKTLKELVRDELTGKMNKTSPEIKRKMRRTVTRIVNEGKGGVICILL